MVYSTALLCVYFGKHLAMPHKYLVNIQRFAPLATKPVVKTGMPSLLALLYQDSPDGLSCEGYYAMQAE